MIGASRELLHTSRETRNSGNAKSLQRPTGCDQNESESAPSQDIIRQEPNVANSKVSKLSISSTTSPVKNENSLKGRATVDYLLFLNQQSDSLSLHQSAFGCCLSVAFASSFPGSLADMIPIPLLMTL